MVRDAHCSQGDNVLDYCYKTHSHSLWVFPIIDQLWTGECLGNGLGQDEQYSHTSDDAHNKHQVPRLQDLGELKWILII